MKPTDPITRGELLIYLAQARDRMVGLDEVIREDLEAKPEPKFKVGDRAFVSLFGYGRLVEFTGWLWSVRRDDGVVREGVCETLLEPAVEPLPEFFKNFPDNIYQKDGQGRYVTKEVTELHIGEWFAGDGNGAPLEYHGACLASGKRFLLDRPAMQAAKKAKEAKKPRLWAWKDARGKLAPYKLYLQVDSPSSGYVPVEIRDGEVVEVPLW